MITVRIIYWNGTEDIKDFTGLEQMCLDGVKEYKVIRQEKAA